MSLFHHLDITSTRRGFSRRSFLHYVSAGAVAAGTLDFRDLMSVQAGELRKQGMSLILLWMQGGPSLGCAIAKEIAAPDHDLPTVVSVGQGGPGAGFVGSGFLGDDYDPFLVPNPGQLPQNVAVPVQTPRFERRLGLLGNLESDFASRGGEIAVADHKKLYEKTKRLVLSPDVKTFEFAGESQ